MSLFCNLHISQHGGRNGRFTNDMSKSHSVVHVRAHSIVHASTPLFLFDLAHICFNVRKGITILIVLHVISSQLSHLKHYKSTTLCIPSFSSLHPHIQHKPILKNQNSINHNVKSQLQHSF